MRQTPTSPHVPAMLCSSCPAAWCPTPCPAPCAAAMLCGADAAGIPRGGGGRLPFVPRHRCGRGAVLPRCLFKSAIKDVTRGMRVACHPLPWVASLAQHYTRPSLQACMGSALSRAAAPALPPADLHGCCCQPHQGTAMHSASVGWHAVLMCPLHPPAACRPARLLQPRRRP